MSTRDYLARKRADLAQDYARLRKAHAPRIGVAQQLRRATTSLLKAEIAADKARTRAAARTGTSLAADLDLFVNR